MPTPDNVSVANVDVSSIISQEPVVNTDEAAPVEPVTTDTPAAPVIAAEDTPVTLDLDLPATDTAVPAPVVTGVTEFDTVGKMLAEKGVAGTSEIMERFTDSGELTLEDKATMIEALGESVASMAFASMEKAAESIISEAKADTAKSMDYANKKFNGTDGDTTWKEMQAYVRGEDSPFSETDLATMNTMLANGGLQAELVIDRVHQAYTGDKNVSLPGSLLEGDSAPAGLTFEPISRADYTAEMSTAVRKYGEDSHQVNELNRRRTLSMSRGY